MVNEHYGVIVVSLGGALTPRIAAGIGMMGRMEPVRHV